MRLLCQKMLLLIAVSPIACTDSSGPFDSRQFVLHDISGRSLPTYLAPTPGLTPTIVSGSLILESGSHAVIMEHRVEYDGTERDVTSTYTYKINGAKIEFEPVTMCPPNAICAGPPAGTITALGISLDLAPGNPGFIVYNYKFAPND
jgi:hypothetical protein